MAPLTGRQHRSLDSELKQAILSSKTAPTSEAAQMVEESLKEFNFTPVVHKENGKIAVVGFSEDLHAKVQTTLAKDGAVLARYNGRAYDLNEAPDWSEYPSGAGKISWYYRKSAL